MLLEDIRPNVKHDRDAERRYHKDIGFPEQARMPHGFSPIIKLTYGSHARDRSSERYIPNLPNVIDLRKADLFEIGVVGRTVSKLGFRYPYDEKNDLVMMVGTKDGFVRTVWLNDKNDHHRTLNKSQYIDPAKHPF